MQLFIRLAAAEAHYVMPAEAGIQSNTPAASAAHYVMPAEAGIQSNTPAASAAHYVMPAEAGIQSNIPAASAANIACRKRGRVSNRASVRHSRTPILEINR